MLITNIRFIEQNVRSLKFDYWNLYTVFMLAITNPAITNNSLLRTHFMVPSQENVLYNELLPKDKQEKHFRQKRGRFQIFYFKMQHNVQIYNQISFIFISSCLRIFTYLVCPTRLHGICNPSPSPKLHLFPLTVAVQCEYGSLRRK